MFLSNAEQWANQTFQHAKLGDPRRVRRLVKIASSLASNTGKSIVRAMNSAAEIEAAYRFVRNESIAPEAIAEAGFAATADKAKAYDCLLALEDTTSLLFEHDSVSEELGHTTSRQSSRGMHVHSVLLFAPEQQEVVGLIEQTRWARDSDAYGQRKRKDKRAYHDKESYKWERSSRAMAQRLHAQMDNVISVCDREADIIDYLKYKLSEQQRFIVRSMQTRCIEESQQKLYQFSEGLQNADTRVVQVKQKGGRKARQAICDVRYAPVTLKMPANKKGASVGLYYVCCEEKNYDEGMCWHLLTSEPVSSPEDAKRILDYYEKRWLIEEFHKAWKSAGTQVEDLRMQSRGNLERIIVVLAFIAVRIHQLRYLGLNKQGAEEQSCEKILSPLAWKLLWRKMESSPIPASTPSSYWAYLNLAKLGGWNDSKRTGRVGWESLWEGWFKLQTILEGYELALSLESDL